MADEQVADWPPEPIPNEARLFLRVHVNHVRYGAIQPAAFRAHGPGMSTDWEKYSTPQETRARTGAPEKYGVLALPVGGTRGIRGLAVEHTPTLEPKPNRAHSDVLGLDEAVPHDERTARREQLAALCPEWEIAPA